MKKAFRVLFTFVALMGIANCLVLEPALASVSHHETACASDDGCDDCFLCCSFNHQIIPSAFIQSAPVSTVSAFVETFTARFVDAPPSSIFHPPLAV